MFDPEEYFEHVERELSSCRAAHVEPDGPHYFPTRSKWDAIQFRVLVEFRGGEIMEVGDYWQRRRHGALMRTFHYQFMKPDGSLIFRLDTHGGEIQYDGKCHVHIPDGNNEIILEDDDARLHGYRLSGVDFSTAFSLAHLYMKGKQMPWDNAE